MGLAVPANPPPPPDHPRLPPRIALPAERAISLRTSDGVELEARAFAPPSARRAVVLCHPHPLYGGTMDNAVVVMIARAILERAGDAAAVLRFNFRGVGDSGGDHDRGRGEVHDAISAVRTLRTLCPQARVTLAGYSFGSWVALRAASHDAQVERVALIAPATALFTQPVVPRADLPIEIAVGDRDPLVALGEARALAAQLGASLHVIEGADHSFVRQRRALAERILPFLLPGMVAP